MANPVFIPIDDDLAVYARAVEQYLTSKSVQNLAIVILAQRVLVERVKSQRKAARRAAVYAAIERINTDADYRSRIAATGDSKTALAKLWPRYLQARLIGDG